MKKQEGRVSAVTANERRAEILRILIVRRFETAERLANEFSVTERTIRSDILLLSAKYPIETQRGHCGGIRIQDWYHPHRKIFTNEQETVLKELLPIASKQQQKILVDMLMEYGSQAD